MNSMTGGNCLGDRDGPVFLNDFAGGAVRGERSEKDSMPSVVSINVGKAQDVAWRGKAVTTAIWKEPVAGPVRVSLLGAEGDQQADLLGHGGEQRALMVYQVESYKYWQEFLRRDDFSLGQFGENLTVSGLPDDEVCVGDRYRVGGAVVEVSQPRVTCYKVGIRMNDERMPALLVKHRRPGFYVRVIEEGFVSAGDCIAKLSDGPGRMSVADVDGLLYTSEHPLEKLDKALRINALSVGWRRSFEALRDAAMKHSVGNVGLSPLGASAAPSWPGFRALRVAAKRHESDDVVSFSLVSGDGQALPQAKPGQYLTVRVKPAPGAPAEIRSYSLCGPDGAYRIGVKRDGTVSGFLHDAVVEGGTIEAAAPRGAFVLDDQDAPVVLLSAGIGVTPMLAMLHAESAAKAERPLWWVHSARDGAHHPFASEVRDRVRKLRDGRSVVFYSRPTAADEIGVGYDVVGRLDVARLAADGMPMDAVFYLCGPAAFATALTSALAGMAVDPAHIRSESFGPSSVAQSGVLPHPPSGDAGEGPGVRFMRSGLSVRWSNRFASLLELAEACDVPVRWSCRTGVCHNCECAVVDGDTNYAIEPVDRPPNGRTLLCCAVPKSDVVLEL
jgi:ferredoxin-NADP reductase/MOSC domain-containing protein YiiM/ferredoxin